MNSSFLSTTHIVKSASEWIIYLHHLLSSKFSKYIPQSFMLTVEPQYSSSLLFTLDLHLTKKEYAPHIIQYHILIPYLTFTIM